MRPPADAELAVRYVVAVLAVAAGVSAPATASAEETCVSREHYQYVCHDPDYPSCLAYGSLGEEARFHLGSGCPWPWG